MDLSFLNTNNYQSANNLFREDTISTGSNITIDYNTIVYQTSNVYATSNYITSNIYETSNFISYSNYYLTSNYDYSTSNFYSTSNYFSSNYYSTSNYFSSNYYPSSNYFSSNYYSTSNYNTSNYITSNLFITGSNVNSITNIFNPWKFKASMSNANQNLTANVWTTLECSYEEYDLANGYNPSNYTYTIQKTGYYYSDYSIVFLASSVINNEIYQGRLLINGTEQTSRTSLTSVKTNDELLIAKANNDYLYAGDTVQLQAISSANSTVRAYNGSHFNMHLLSIDQLENNGTLYLNDNPIGSIIDYTGTVAPSNFLMCDGSSVSRTTYSNLFAVIGTTYGTGDGVSTFNVPDLRNKYVIGASNNVGSTIGSNNLFNSNLSSVSDAFVFTTGTGYALSKSNMPPSMYLNKIIKYASVDNAITQNNFNTYNISSNLYYSSNYYSTSNYSTSNYFSSNYYSTSNYFSSNYYSTSNYSTSNYFSSNYYPSSNYYSSNYITSNLYTSNNYGTDVRNVYNEYWGRAFMDATQSNLTTGVWYSLPVNQFEYQGSNSGFNLSTNTLTVPVEGVYRFSYGVEFAGGFVNDVCHVRLLKNGTEEELHKEQAVIKSGQTQDITLTDIIKLNAGDTIKLQAKVDSGTNVIDVLGNPYYLGGPDLSHLSWVLEAATGVLTNSNLYLNTSATQTASNFTAFAGYSNSLIATNMWVNTSNVGINTSSPFYCLDLNCTGAMRLPRGTDAQRPSNADGLLRYNTTSNIFEGCSNNTWSQIGGSTSTTRTGTITINQSNIANPYTVRAGPTGAAQSIPSTTWTKVNYTTEAFDNNNNYNASTATYTAPVSGYYNVSAQVLYGSPIQANKSWSLAIYRNSSNISENIIQNGSLTDYTSTSVNDLVYMQTNDTLQFYTYHTASVSTNLYTDNVHVNCSISLNCIQTASNITVSLNQSGTGTISPNITNVYNPYRFRAFLSNNQSIANASFVPTQYSNITFDTNSNYNLANWRYTAPVSGIYSVIVQSGYTNVVANKRYYASIWKNGAGYNFYTHQSSTTNDITVNCKDLISLSANDYIEGRSYHEAGTTINVLGNSNGVYTFMDVSLLCPSVAQSLTFTVI